MSYFINALLGKEIPDGQLGIHKREIAKRFSDIHFNNLRKQMKDKAEVDCYGREDLKNMIMQYLETEVEKQLPKHGLPGEKIIATIKLYQMNSNGEFKEEANQRNSPEAMEWRKQVFQRDKYTCVECGIKGKIQSHHIKEWAKHPELRYEIDNGITLCVDCHCKKHPGREALIKSSKCYSRRKSNGKTN